jgi:hypothetical protein
VSVNVYDLKVGEKFLDDSFNWVGTFLEINEEDVLLKWSHRISGRSLGASRGTLRQLNNNRWTLSSSLLEELL